MAGSASRGTRPRELTYRQRSAQLLGWVYVVVAAVLGIALARSWGRDPNPAFLAWLAVGLGLAWALFLRPHVRVAADGVTLANVLRDVFIPWQMVQEVRTRWNLEVLTPAGRYTSWAISTQVDRPRSGIATGLGWVGGSLGGLGAGRDGAGRTGDADMAGAGRARGPSAAVTSRVVADVIEATREEYARAASLGLLPAQGPCAVRVRWQPAAIAALVIPLAVALVTVLG